MRDEEQKEYLEDVETVRRVINEIDDNVRYACCGVSDQEVVEFLEALRDQGLELRRIRK